jgi:hypothetical protein
MAMNTLRLKHCLSYLGMQVFLSYRLHNERQSESIPAN